ncbi:uncharacterized protein ATC70_000222 [Mucor velutinosus]|uniref:Dbl homology domain-containing protein n=1 Tax=Mucor velutinosus TaxID=708070 RepID=A0AAN7DJ44_9FUNG|nr:hypothetical protein ATC70_000222 [Mucor velutinosus]
MIDFTKEASQSLISTTSSAMSNSLMHVSSISRASSFSQSSSELEPLNLKFITEDQTYYNQLMEDLSIVDNMCDVFDNDMESSASFDKQVLDIARQVSLKHQVLNQLLQSENDYLDDLFTFHEIYTLKIQPWLLNTTDKDLTSKFLSTPHKDQLNSMFQNIHTIAVTHKAFLVELKERIQLWGPTQLVSDIFSHLYSQLDAYEPFMLHHPDYVMALDTLYHIPCFAKLVQSITEKHAVVKVQDIVYCLHVPLHRLSVYNKALSQLKRYSDPAYPDYTALHSVSRKFKQLESQWADRAQDCQSHLMVLEASRAIDSCPILVTHKRRLLLFANLIKVDLDDITLTSDTRMYFLYNDSLIYCKKLKENKKGSTAAAKKLTYKGTLNLQGADIRQLAPSFCAKMCEVKKPLFRIGKKSSSSSDTSSLPGVEAFGFELVTSESNLDAMSPLHQNYQSAMAGAGAPIRRRHVLRTKSQLEQKTWFETIRKAIAIANAQE